MVAILKISIMIPVSFLYATLQKKKQKKTNKKTIIIIIRIRIIKTRGPGATSLT
jgi:hypothetical protein